jgi:hypothetical protein
MWLACALIVLFSVGFVLPCMLDITTTHDSEFVMFGKATWLFIAGAFWVFGALAWVLVGRPNRLSFLHRTNPYADGGFSQAESLLRHPAAQGAAGYAEPGGPFVAFGPRVLGPDDDPDFMAELAERIREDREGSLTAEPGLS